MTLRKWCGVYNTNHSMNSDLILIMKLSVLMMLIMMIIVPLSIPLISLVARRLAKVAANNPDNIEEVVAWVVIAKSMFFIY